MCYYYHLPIFLCFSIAQLVLVLGGNEIRLIWEWSFMLSPYLVTIMLLGLHGVAAHGVCNLFFLGRLSQLCFQIVSLFSRFCRSGWRTSQLCGNFNTSKVKKQNACYRSPSLEHGRDWLRLVLPNLVFFTGGGHGNLNGKNGVDGLVDWLAAVLNLRDLEGE